MFKLVLQTFRRIFTTVSKVTFEYLKEKKIQKLIFLVFQDYRILMGEGNGTLLQYSCLENPMDGGAWKAAGLGIAEGQT